MTFQQLCERRKADLVAAYESQVIEFEVVLGVVLMNEPASRSYDPFDPNAPMLLRRQAG